MGSLREKIEELIEELCERVEELERQLSADDEPESEVEPEDTVDVAKAIDSIRDYIEESRGLARKAHADIGQKTDLLRQSVSDVWKNLYGELSSIRSSIAELKGRELDIASNRAFKAADALKEAADAMKAYLPLRSQIADEIRRFRIPDRARSSGSIDGAWAIAMNDLADAIRGKSL